MDEWKKEGIELTEAETQLIMRLLFLSELDEAGDLHDKLTDAGAERFDSCPISYFAVKPKE